MKRNSRLVVSLLAVALAVALAVYLQTLPRPTNIVAFSVFRCACDLFAMRFVLGRARWERSGRGVWRFLFAGLTLLLLGDLLAVFLFLNPGVMPIPEWALSLLLHVAPILAFVLALLVWHEPSEGGESSPRVQAVLDGLLFGYATFFLIWALGLRPWEHSSRFSQSFASLVVRFTLMSVLLGICVFRGSTRPSRWRGPMMFIGTSFLLLATASAVSSASILGGLGPAFRIAGGVLKIGALLALAQAAIHPGPLDGTPDHPGHDGFADGIYDNLPFLPVLLAGCGALVTGALPTAPLDQRILLLGAPILLLLLVRQALAFRSVRLFSLTLESRVLERTRALEAAQSAVMRTERMNAVAMLGAGLAHDLKNALSSIRGYSEIMAEDLQQGAQPNHKDLERILVASEQATNLANRLMAYGREEETGEVLDMGLELQRMEELLRMLMPRQVRLQFSIAPEAPVLIRASRSCLEQILVNVVSNAKDAIPGEGLVTLAIQVVQSGQGPEAELTIQDTGVGMSAEVQARLFEPFFTTKPPGKGTGLGLSSVRAIVLKEGGTLRVHSELGVGTTISLSFPLVKAPPGAEPAI